MELLTLVLISIPDVSSLAKKVAGFNNFIEVISSRVSPSKASQSLVGEIASTFSIMMPARISELRALIIFSLTVFYDHNKCQSSSVHLVIFP
jgi:hypothetical protein